MMSRTSSFEAPGAAKAQTAVDIPAAGAGEAARLARVSGTKMVFNPAPVSDEIVAAVLPHTDVPIVNRQEKEKM